MDEPQVRQSAEEGGGAVQGLARAEHHHRARVFCETASRAQARCFGQAPRDERDLVRGKAAG
ncbi:hypothetical protein OG883_39970 [Streptomyces sp. NBC_01142]|uniref:hypothetical protein n=1 Tax=Streptomyces sp. NBC_01142 TaxID=2975865 RepID=UPI00224CE086|nr:hypothetical protein [Streptomyces sp. NBC_01142]MCX4825883.1 hypothetical protein [Streptomyces sp. NBC_01142]